MTIPVSFIPTQPMNTITSTSRFLRIFALPVLTAGICLADTARAAVILNETFPAGQRLAQDWPGTSTWYATGTGSPGAGVNDNASGSLQLSINNTWNALTYFTESGKPVSLGVGDSLRLSLNFEVQTKTAPGDNTLRIALLNSGGNRITGDLGAGSSTTFRDYTGYYVNVRPTLQTSTSSIFGLAKRNKSGGSNYLLSEAYNAITSSSDSGATATAKNSLKSGVSYTFEVVYTRISESTLNVSVAMSGAGLDNYAYSFNDTQSPFTAFDTFAIGSTNGTTFDSVTLHSLNITLASIPEPDATGAVLGGGGLVALLLIRRRH
jgi:MYXO-CTERM domain-containing protein